MLLSDICLCLSSVCCVRYIGHNSRTESPRKTKIGLEVAHVTRDSDITFKVKRSKVNLLLMSYIANGGLPHSLLTLYAVFNLFSISYYVLCVRFYDK